MKLIMENWKQFLNDQRNPGSSANKDQYSDFYQKRDSSYKKDKRWVHKPGKPGLLITGAPAGESHAEMQRGSYYLRNLIYKNIISGKIQLKSLPESFQYLWNLNVIRGSNKPVDYIDNVISVDSGQYFGNGKIIYHARGMKLQGDKRVDTTTTLEYQMDEKELREYEKLRPYAKNIRAWDNAHSEMELDPDFKVDGKDYGEYKNARTTKAIYNLGPGLGRQRLMRP